MRHLPALLLAAGALLPAAPVWAQPAEQMTVSPADMFAIVDAARDRGDLATAEAALRALSRNRDAGIRQEARFRLGMMLAANGRHSEAASLFREILDDEPKAQRVRLELARTLDAMGDEAGARRALREVQAGGLPPDVARFVDRYAAALRAQKPLGVSLDLALAPDSNINRAPQSRTFGTVVGDFELDEDSRRRSGVGAALRLQAFARTPLSDQTSLLVRMEGSADLYRETSFNDVALTLLAGPEFRLGSHRLNIEAGPQMRWYGGQPYARNISLAATWLAPIGRTSQLRSTVSVGSVDNHFNDLQDGSSYAMAFSYERALSARSGVGASLSVDRKKLGDPIYSTIGGQLGVFGYREFGAVTVIGAISLGHLEADARLPLFPRRRVDRLARGSLTMTWRELKLGSLAPLLRITAESNSSTIELYSYRRLRTEVGVTRAF